MPLCASPESGPRAVLIIAAEDSAEHTIKPRAEAAGADLNLIRVSETIRIADFERPIRFPEDFTLLEREIMEYKIGLVVIDPLLGFLSQTVDSNKDQSVRDVLHQMKLVAERTGAAILGLRHLAKAGNGNALYRGLGSIGITAAARSAIAVDNHPINPGEYVLASVKCNLIKLPRSLTYRIAERDGRALIEWGEECDVTAEELGVRDQVHRSGKADEAVEFLLDLLENGPVLEAEVRKRAEAAGIKKRTLDRAKTALHVKSEKLGFVDSAWAWKLPSAVERQGYETAKGCQSNPG